jgi:ankyrin repeat protein
MNRVDQELIEAAKENNLPEVNRLLRVGADIEVKGTEGSTPLHWACRGHVQVFKELVEHGADIEAKDDFYRTPLHYACYKGHSPVVIELLIRGADTEAKDNEGWTPLHWAGGEGRLAVVNELLSPNDSSDGATTSILGKRKSRAGANTEVQTNQSDTPLHHAASRGHLSVVKALLAVGANILAANNRGYLPVHVAVGNGHSELSKYLLRQFYATTCRLPLHGLVEDLTWIGDHSSRDAPPLRAALHRNVLGTDDVVEIIEYVVDRNPAWFCSRDEDGSLPVHLACRRGVSFKIVQSLVNHDKASVKSVTPEGDLPLFLACEMPETSLDTIFLLMKLYPDLVYR